MVFIRGSLLVIICILLFLSILFMNTFLTLSLSLKYDHIKSVLSSVIQEVAEKENGLTENLETNYDIIQSHCQTNVEYTFIEESLDYVFVIPCDIALKGTNNIVEYALGNFTYDIYYKNYDCDYPLGCFKQVDGFKDYFVFVSKTAKDYWQSKFYISIIAILVFALFIFLLAKKKTNSLIIIGVLLALASLLFMKSDLFLSFEADKYFLEIFSILFTQASKVAVIGIIIGIIILGLGIGLKFWDFEHTKRVMQQQEQEVADKKKKEDLKKAEKKIAEAKMKIEKTKKKVSKR